MGGPRFWREREREMRNLHSVCRTAESCVSTRPESVANEAGRKTSWCVFAGSEGAKGQRCLGPLNRGPEVALEASAGIPPMQACVPERRQQAASACPSARVPAKSGAAAGSPARTSNKMERRRRNALIQAPHADLRNRSGLSPFPHERELCGSARGHRLNEWVWCGRRELNPHGLAACGFSYHFGFRRPARCEFVVWTIPSPFLV